MSKYFLTAVLLIVLFSISFIAHSQGLPSGDETYANKRYPKELEYEVKEALSYYPELNDVAIDFIFKDNINHAVMQAQPRVRSLMRSKGKRRYKVKMQRMLFLNHSVMSIEELPHDIIVGWLAHELGHIIDYKERSSINMVGFGVRYFTSRNYLKSAERRADTYAIGHGFADHLIKTKNYILHKGDLTEEYKARIDELYISPEEVKDIEAGFQAKQENN